MTRVSLLGVLVGASAALSACDLPSVTFNGSGGGAGSAGGSGAISASGPGGGGGMTTSTTSTTSSPTTSTGGDGAGGVATTGGTGGVGGTGGTGGATTTSTGTGGTGGGPTGAVVSCNYPTISDCEAGKVCCLDKSRMEPKDICKSPGTCNPASQYAEIQCNDNGDCPGQTCCAYVPLELEGTYCADSCSLSSKEVPACDDSFDCLGIPPFLSCKAVLGYPNYKFCQVP